MAAIATTPPPATPANPREFVHRNYEYRIYPRPGRAQALNTQSPRNGSMDGPVREIVAERRNGSGGDREREMPVPPSPQVMFQPLRGPEDC